MRKDMDKREITDYEGMLTDETQNNDSDAFADCNVGTVHYWLYAPGQSAIKWDECREKGIMLLGWGEIGDLNTFASKDEMKMRTIHSANLYQIFTYVKNKEVELSGRRHEVSGMLLYAGTDDALVPCNEYRMSGNKISVRTLDLNQNFSEIKKQLNHIAEIYLGVKPERRDDRWRFNQ